MSNRNEDLTREERVENPRFKRIPFKFPAQWTFEAMHALDRQLNDISGRGVKIEGQDRVVNRLKEAIPEEFLQNARLGYKLGKEPVISDLRLSHDDLEVIGFSFLSLPTIDRLM